ncbi:predicted protein [Lichtheimia corymbifera JMRC:FSU:9682]|uniref:Uncharacterized protein n=1 Tax=Lichtheimia corymbifera JMRC:FSU:9682 TaxID=1263082 RepID=A0A068RH04_9FUNG|nr:predicted protein [Lichtheimia corymbifera JMRC:FSU:9682]
MQQSFLNHAPLLARFVPDNLHIQGFWCQGAVHNIAMSKVERASGTTGLQHGVYGRRGWQLRSSMRRTRRILPAYRFHASTMRCHANNSHPSLMWRQLQEALAHVPFDISGSYNHPSTHHQQQ